MQKSHQYESGDRYGRLTLTGKCLINTSGKQPRKEVEWICDCKKIGWSNFYKIRTGHTTSCGCYHAERKKEAKTKHGLCRHILNYSIWHGIKNRCYNVNDIPYPDYGGRGIKVCDEWLNDFMSFYNWAINNGYKKGLQIDRIDNNGNYEPANCRFTTHTINQRNKRNNVFLSAFGEIKTFAEWITDKRCSVTEAAIRNRLKNMGWDMEKAISTPNTHKK